MALFYYLKFLISRFGDIKRIKTILIFEFVISQIECFYIKNTFWYKIIVDIKIRYILYFDIKNNK